MALIKCPHCGTENDTRTAVAEGGVAKCRQCAFVIVTPEIAERILRQSDGGPRTDIRQPEVPHAPAGGSPSRPLRLKATAGADAGKEWHAEKAVLFIGRRNVDVVLGDPDASRQHCVLELHGDRWVLKDLDSTNGTYLDDAKVKVAEIKDGSRIRIGDTVLVAALEPAP